MSILLSTAKLQMSFFIIIIFIITGLIEYTTYSTYHHAGVLKSPILSTLCIAGMILFPLLLAGTAIWGAKHFSTINSILYTVSNVWLGLVIYLFMGAIVISILVAINTHLGAHIPILIVSKMIILICVVFCVYGIYNASTPKVVYWKLHSESLSSAWAGKKIAIISDTHFGQVRRTAFAEKIVSLINNEHPDIVFHLGDLIDGPSFPYTETFTPLEKLQPPMGTLYVEGNHELYSQEYDQFRAAFPKSFTDVTDKKIVINNTQIIGLSFAQKETQEETKQRLEKLSYDPTVPSIILMHDPKNDRALIDEKVSLAMSGHTHGGQLFPGTLLVKMIYGNFSHGISYADTTATLTSYGVGTALVPMRIGTTPEIIILEIQ